MKEQLEKAIKEFSIVAYNKKIMIDYLGEDNLKNYPFNKVEVLLANSQSQGKEVVVVDLKTYRNEHYCTVADMGEMKLNEDLLQRIGNQMLKDLTQKTL